jgi:hypothetical protein
MNIILLNEAIQIEQNKWCLNIQIYFINAFSVIVLYYININ